MPGLCVAHYVAERYQSTVRLQAIGTHSASGYSIILWPTTQEEPPLHWVLEHTAPAGISLDVVTPFLISEYFHLPNSSVSMLQVDDAAGTRQVPIRDVERLWPSIPGNPMCDGQELDREPD